MRVDEVIGVVGPVPPPPVPPLNTWLGPSDMWFVPTYRTGSF